MSHSNPLLPLYVIGTILALTMGLVACNTPEEIHEAQRVASWTPTYSYDPRTNKCFVDFNQGLSEPQETECSPQVMELAR